MAIWRMKPISPSLIIFLYKVIVLPIHGYCDVIWFPDSVKLSKKLDKLHDRIIHTIPSNINQRLIPLPSEQRKYYLAVQAYKVLHNLSPPYMQESLRYTQEVTQK